jgi:hypothetical protein
MKKEDIKMKQVKCISMCIFMCFLIVNTSYGIDYKSQEYLKNIVAYIKKVDKLPKMIDKETKWFTVTCQYGQVIQHYQMVNYRAQDLKGKGFIAALEKSWKATQSFCGVDNGTGEISLLQYGVYYTYVFYGKNGIIIGSFDILPEECGF